MDRIRIFAVGGTWGEKHELEAVQWYQLGHDLHTYIFVRGFSWLVGEDGRSFEWTGRIAGHQIWKRARNMVVEFFTRKPQDWSMALIDWRVLGDNAYAWLCPPLFSKKHWFPSCETHTWWHSHGGNGGFFACAKGLRCCTFVTFCTPARRDMVETIKAARKNMGFWIEVHSDESDLTQIAGEFADGDLEIVRSFNDLVDPKDPKKRTLKELGLGPDKTIVVDDGHSMILNNAKRFGRLDEILAITKQLHGRAEIGIQP